MSRLAIGVSGPNENAGRSIADESHVGSINGLPINVAEYNYQIGGVLYMRLAMLKHEQFAAPDNWCVGHVQRQACDGVDRGPGSSRGR